MKKIFSNQKTPILQSKITKNHTTQTSNLFFCFLLSVFSFLPSALFGQVTIGKNAEPKSYSVLELYGPYETGSYGGLRLPQLTTPQREALTLDLDADAPGLMIFNTTTECMEMWNGAKWISFCEDAGGESGTAYVEIGGIKWAKSNVNMPGHFAAHPYDAGRFYQWNRRMGWSSTEPMINSSGGNTWDNTAAAGTTWEPENDPCPDGWRVPTLYELEILASASVTHERGTLHGVNGYFIGDVEPKLFLPAAGYRYFSDGSLTNVTNGDYWSSTPSSTSAYSLLFFSDNFSTGIFNRAGAQSIRCVAEF